MTSTFWETFRDVYKAKKYFASTTFAPDFVEEITLIYRNEHTYFDAQTKLSNGHIIVVKVFYFRTTTHAIPTRVTATAALGITVIENWVMPYSIFDRLMTGNKVLRSPSATVK